MLTKLRTHIRIAGLAYDEALRMKVPSQDESRGYSRKIQGLSVIEYRRGQGRGFALTRMGIPALVLGMPFR
jgi:hypothetical protein